MRSLPTRALLLAVAASCTVLRAGAEVADGGAEDLFVRKCASCHTVGSGPRVGPDLKGAHEKRPRAWLEAFIRTPSAMLDADAEARKLLTEFKGVRMPDLGLSPGEVESLVALIERCSTTPCTLARQFTPAVLATEDEVEAGRALFTGHRPLAGGGVPCFSCHSVHGAGTAVAGGRLAKDLTHAFARLGDEGLDAALRNPAFPVMSKVFTDRPLTGDEVYALRSFLARANKADGAPDAGAGPVLPALFGTVTVLAGLDAAWRRRLRGVRRPLTRRKGDER